MSQEVYWFGICCEYSVATLTALLRVETALNRVMTAGMRKCNGPAFSPTMSLDQESCRTLENPFRKLHGLLQLWALAFGQPELLSRR